MNIDLFDKKPEIIINGVKYIDLSQNVFSSTLIYDSILGYEVIDAFTEMRIDKIALKWYGDTSKIGLILKANNIFNPFSIKDGDILIIPNISNPENIYKNLTNKDRDNAIRKKYTELKTTQKTNITALEKLNNKTKTMKDLLKNPLPPNMLRAGESVSKNVGNYINLTSND